MIKIISKILESYSISPLKLRIISNLYYSVLGKVVTLFGSLFVGILVARYLGPEQYGLMNYVISYVSLFSIIASFGLDNIEIRELSKANDKAEFLLGTAFCLRCFFAVVTIILIVITVLLFEADRFTQLMIGVYSFSVIANGFSVIRNYFTSIVYNEFIVKSEISRTFVGAGIKIILLLFHAPLAWFIVATLLDAFLLASGYLFSYRIKVGSIFTWKFDSSIAFFLIGQSFPLLLSGAVVILYQRIDQVMIGNMIDKASVGQFSVATRLAEILLFIPAIMAQTVTPLLVRIKERSVEEYRKKAQLFLDVVVWCSLIAALFMCIASYWIVFVTFGTQYLAAVPVLQVMAFKTVGMALSFCSGQLIIIENIHKYAFIRNLVGCVFCIIANYLLIPIYGIVGSAIVTVFTVVLSGCVSNYLIPSYRPIFYMQMKSLLLGWKNIVHYKKIIF
ncbi:MAG: flippase [Prevotellaceae bacterium]|jgi:O-antigen/teichoic acid export membrane protein|nr:flippase [Prevotellaceae bacterium]